MTPDEARQQILVQLEADRWRAHQILFAERHPNQSAAAHRDLTDSIYDSHPRVLVVAFRGFGKTTTVEESIVIEAAFRGFRNKLIVGASYDRACERVGAIKRIIQQNEYLEQVFGPLRGPVWQEGKIVLANGVCIQALGRDQEMLGTKHDDIRPDSATVDDIEPQGEVFTPGQREKTWTWFAGDFLPALDHPLYTPVRVLGTIRHPESFIVRLSREPGWRVIRIPIEHLDAASGERQATWAGKFPLPVVDAMRQLYKSNAAVFEREFMCNAAATSQNDFGPEMMRVVPREPAWQAVYAMYDPARTTRAASATTGKAVWSWVRNRLIVWDGGGQKWKPDEIIDDIFKTAEQYDPVWLGVEEDGLNEFIRQPLRHEAARRGQMIPFRPIRAPKGKLDFIRGLQPYFAAGEVEFAKDLPELQAQLLSFPTGDIDGPNALAYALLLRPGAPIYENFRDEHIAPDLALSPWRPLFLAGNARDGVVTAMLVQIFDGRLRVLADWVVEGTPDERAGELQMEAALFGDSMKEGLAGRPQGLAERLKLPDTRPRIGRAPVRWVVPGWHYDKYLNVGLTQAVARVPAAVQRGGAETAGRDYLRDALERVVHGEPAVQVGEQARWTLRALTGGYCRPLRRSGLVGDEAEAGPYRVLIEGLESFLGMIRVGAATEDEDEAQQNWAYDKQGRRYKSAMPAR